MNETLCHYHIEAGSTIFVEDKHTQISYRLVSNLVHYSYRAKFWLI